jgi:hypothetical protein
MPRHETSFQATFAGGGLWLNLIYSMMILGLSASIVAHDHQSAIAIAHLVVVCYYYYYYMCL